MILHFMVFIFFCVWLVGKHEKGEKMKLQIYVKKWCYIAFVIVSMRIKFQIRGAKKTFTLTKAKYKLKQINNATFICFSL